MSSKEDLSRFAKLGFEDFRRLAVVEKQVFREQTVSFVDVHGRKSAARIAVGRDSAL